MAERARTWRLGARLRTALAVALGALVTACLWVVLGCCGVCLAVAASLGLMAGGAK